MRTRSPTPAAFAAMPASAYRSGWRGSDASASTRALPRAGLAFGLYPERRPAPSHAWVEAWRNVVGALPRRRVQTLPAAVAQALLDTRAQVLLETHGPALQSTAVALRVLRADVHAALSRDGFDGAAAGRAIGLASAAMQQTLGLTPYPAQHFAAWLMLQGRLAEMATGEGKTLATALAAGAAALAGVPVHVLTANDYLVQRDAQTLAPFYAALGLSSGAVLQASQRGERGALYRRDVVYSTAKEIGFDYLRDHHGLGDARDPRLQRALTMNGDTSAEPLLPALCFALVDEADSLLLDEACVPLILASPGKAFDAPALRRAFAIAASLQSGQDFALERGTRQALLTVAGRKRVAAAVAGERGLLWPLRRACDFVQSALVAQHLLHRETEYVIAPAGLALIDELTGRIAEGRQWQGALHAMVQIKEGLEPGAPAVTAAQITFQRFFPRYLQLAGMSGTLLESRHELQRLYRCRTTNVPLIKPSQRRWLGRRLFADQATKWAAVIDSVRVHRAAGRPVLIGTDSIGSSLRLSARLTRAGIDHQLLNAVQDVDEARSVARAGKVGCVTVTTNMAGRGTDIRLDAAARAAGGMHVIVALTNRARRIDRQLIGRAARHGDPGSAEAIVALDDALLVRRWPSLLRRAAALWLGASCAPRWLAGVFTAVAQRGAELADARLRLQLRRADAQAEETFAFAGHPE